MTRMQLLLLFLMCMIDAPEVKTGGYETRLNRLFELQAEIKELHPSLARLYPVAIVENDSFNIYDIDSSGRNYEFKKSAPTGMPLPEKVRAAFPLGVYGGRNVCIVTGDVFNEEEGYATIFHEFVHCYQYENYSQPLKKTLRVAQKAAARGDYMWELNHPFPYQDKRFIRTFGRFQTALRAGDKKTVTDRWREIRAGLTPEDYEYLVWEMWSEGFARLMENRIRDKLKLEQIGTTADPPYDRISFYAVGASYIEYIEKRNSGALEDLASLFRSMK